MVDDKIYIAGHGGMVGSAILRALVARGRQHITTRTHAELDLTDQKAVRRFFRDERPTHVYLAAAKVGVREGVSLGRMGTQAPPEAAQPELAAAAFDGFLGTTTEYRQEEW